MQNHSAGPCIPAFFYSVRNHLSRPPSSIAMPKTEAHTKFDPTSSSSSTPSWRTSAAMTSPTLSVLPYPDQQPPIHHRWHPLNCRLLTLHRLHPSRYLPGQNISSERVQQVLLRGEEHRKEHESLKDRLHHERQFEVNRKLALKEKQNVWGINRGNKPRSKK